MQEPQPQLAELLRTCVHPVSLLLQIVHVDFLEVAGQRDDPKIQPGGDGAILPDIPHRYAIKYIVSDGEIMMQALLHRKLSVLRDAADVVVGDLLDIRRFTVKRSRRTEGHGHVVYLAIEDCHFLQQVRLPGGFVPEEREAAQGNAALKRKRTPPFSEIVGVARNDSDVHAGRNKAARNSPILPPDEPSTPPHQATESAASNAHQRDMANQAKAASSRQLPDSKTDLPSPDHSLAIADDRQELRQSSIMMETKQALSKGDRSDILRNTFGARQIMSDDEDDDFFEALSANQTTVKQRRKVLHKIDGNISFGSQPSSGIAEPDSFDKDIVLTPFQEQSLLQYKAPIPVLFDQILGPPARPPPKKSVRDGTFALSQTPTSYLPPPPRNATKSPAPQRQVQTQPVLQQPPTQPTILPSPPFHTLSSLRNPSALQNLPAKSYTLTTLAVITWTGTATIHRPGSLFPPKRHLKIVDPSLAASRPTSRQARPQPQPSAQASSVSSFKGQNSFQDAVTVAVYIDAANFKPASGTLVLFRGLVMQRLVNGDIILNAYGRLKEQQFEVDITEKQEDADGKNIGGEVDGDAISGAGSLDTHWFITDHAKIRRLGHGSRLDYYLDWWAEKQRGLQVVQN